MNRMRALLTAAIVAGSAGMAAAQTATPQVAPSVAPSQGLNTGSSVAPTIDPKAGLRLTDAQRGMILQSVNREKSKVKPVSPDITASVGTDLPPSLELYHMPDPVVAEIPNAKLYKYTVIHNDVVVVDPTKMRVVEVIRP